MLYHLPKVGFPMQKDSASSHANVVERLGSICLQVSFWWLQLCRPAAERNSRDGEDLKDLVGFIEMLGGETTLWFFWTVC